MGNMYDWAKREVEIACRKENPDKKEGEFDHGCACYESALKAFESLCNDGHSGFSIKMTQNILNKLINGEPLTPIEDPEDVWNRCNEKGDVITYQCARVHSLFKDVYPDGTVKYKDLNRIVCVDLIDPHITFAMGLANDIIDEMFPITMPYMPEKTAIRVICRNCLVDSKNGDFDTIGIFSCIKYEDGFPKTIDIRRFFKEENGDIVEIDEKEYREREARKIR